ncbi:uncharacterized protein TNCV_484221 [Trichonephila clavipes]|nr:uncharacterized protein TNCV_484221 [Trichonephila clavipes]
MVSATFEPWRAKPIGFSVPHSRTFLKPFDSSNNASRQDNATCYPAGIVPRWSEELDRSFTSLSWPALSPDLRAIHWIRLQILCITYQLIEFRPRRAMKYYGQKVVQYCIEWVVIIIWPLSVCCKRELLHQVCIDGLSAASCGFDGFAVLRHGCVTAFWLLWQWVDGITSAPQSLNSFKVQPESPMKENGTWRRRLNLELYQSYKESDLVNFIKLQQIKWAGHVVRTDENRTTKKVFNAQPISTRRKGMSNLEWIDGLEKDLLVLRTKNWRTLARRRQAWKRLLEKVKSHPWMSSY